ncbi:MAG: hypothetical protein MJ252_18025 [archaeon]|nr:hypothetical protein [archaeon]
MNPDDDLNIRNLDYNEEETGLFFSGTEKVYKWEFVLDRKKRQICLTHSKITGKRLITLDQKVIINSRQYTYNFYHKFNVDQHNISIIQKDSSYELRIDNNKFQNLLKKQKLERYNIIREEYLKKHSMPKEPEPKKENKSMANPKINLTQYPFAKDFFNNPNAENNETNKEEDFNKPAFEQRSVPILRDENPLFENKEEDLKEESHNKKKKKRKVGKKGKKVAPEDISNKNIYQENNEEENYKVVKEYIGKRQHDLLDLSEENEIKIENKVEDKSINKIETKIEKKVEDKIEDKFINREQSDSERTEKLEGVGNNIDLLGPEIYNSNNTSERTIEQSFDANKLANFDDDNTGGRNRNIFSGNKGMNNNIFNFGNNIDDNNDINKNLNINALSGFKFP